MTQGLQSAVAYRSLVCATVGTPGSGEDLANINTAPLPDGSSCFVTGTRQFFRLRKYATIAAVAGAVIVPNAGGGRWVLEGVAAGALAALVAGTSTNTTDASTTGNWLGVNSINFALQAGTGAWSFNPGSCILTLTGPGGRYLCDIRASVSPVEGNGVNVVASLNDDITGTTAAFTEGEQFANVGANFEGGQQTIVLAAARVVTLVVGDNIRPKFRYSGGADLDIDRFTLSVTPIP